MPSLVPISFDAYVIAAAFLGEVAAFALGDGRVALVGGSSPNDVTPRIVDAHRDGILAASSDGRRLLSGGSDGRLVATTADGTRELLAEKTRKWIDAVAPGPQGAIGFAAGRSAFVRLADGSEREFVHAHAVTGVAFLPKGLRLVTSTYDMARILWVTTDGKPIDLPWKGAHLGVTVSPDGRYVITTMQEPGLHGWRLDDGRHLRMTGYPTKVRSLSWSAKGRHLASSGANAAVVWPFVTKEGPMGKAPLELGVNRALASRVAFHPREEVLAVGYEDGLVLAIRLEDQAEVVLRPVPSAPSPVTALAWDEAGRRLAFGTEAGDVGLVDIAA